MNVHVPTGSLPMDIGVMSNDQQVEQVADVPGAVYAQLERILLLVSKDWRNRSRMQAFVYPRIVPSVPCRVYSLQSKLKFQTQPPNRPCSCPLPRFLLTSSNSIVLSICLKKIQIVEKPSLKGGLLRDRSITLNPKPLSP